jgi:predicted nucleotidyltransferase component of viral defense system
LTKWQPAACRLASLDDLAAMKVAALAQRGSRKDFVDLFALGLEHCSLGRMLRLYQRKYRVTDIAHVLYSLAYFDDAKREPMPRLLWTVRWLEIERTLGAWLRHMAGP